MPHTSSGDLPERVVGRFLLGQDDLIQAALLQEKIDELVHFIVGEKKSSRRVLTVLAFLLL